VLFFLRTISEVLRTVVEADTLMSSLGMNRDRYFVLWSSLRRNVHHTDKYLERYINFKWVFRQRGKLFAQSTQKCGKVTFARYEFEISIV